MTTAQYTLEQATVTAKFQREVVVKITRWDGNVSYVSSKEKNVGQLRPQGYDVSVEVVADYTQA